MVKDELLNSSLELLPHPIYIIDPHNYIIKKANSAALRNHLPEDSTCYALFHRRNEPCSNSDYVCPLQELKKTKEPVKVEHIHLDINGNARNVEIYVYPVMDANGRMTEAVGYYQDITECKEAKILLENLLRISRLINKHGDTEEVYKKVSDSIQELIGFDNLVIFRVVTQKVSLAYYSGEQDTIENVRLQCEELVNRCIEIRKSLLKNDDKREKSDEKGMKSHIVVPLINGGECIGGIHISRAAENYSQHDLEVLESIGEVFTPVLRNSPVSDEIKDPSNTNQKIEFSQIEVLLNTSQKLQINNSWKEGLATIVEGMSCLGFDRCGIFLVNMRKETINFHYGKGIESSDFELTISLKDSRHPAVKSVLERKMCFEPFLLNGLGIMPGSCFVWAPIIVQNDVFAVLAAGTDDKIKNDDMRYLEFLAGMCGNFIERTKVDVNPIPEKKLETEFKYWLDPAECYIVTEVKPRKSFDIFVELVTHGIPGFVISREHPLKIKKKYKLVRTPVLWLSRSEAENSINPEDFLKMNYTLRKFTRKSEESVILLDGLEYLMIQTSFATTMKYLQELKDMVITNNSRLIIPLHKGTLSEREFSILEKEFTIIPPW